MRGSCTKWGNVLGLPLSCGFNILKSVVSLSMSNKNCKAPLRLLRTYNIYNIKNFYYRFVFKLTKICIQLLYILLLVVFFNCFSIQFLNPSVQSYTYLWLAFRLLFPRVLQFISSDLTALAPIKYSDVIQWWF